MRKLFRQTLVPLAAICSLSGFLAVISSPIAPAGASPSQNNGSDTSAYQSGWSCKYTEVYTINAPGTGYFQVDETDTYTVAGVVSHTEYTCPASYTGGVCNSSTPGAIAGATYNTYAVNISGTVTGGTGNADSETVTVKGGSVTGTEYLETSNLATVEVDQVQNVTGTVSVDNLALTLTNDDVYTPAQVTQDYRLHANDQWLENTDVYDSGLVTYNASGLVNESGTDPIDSYGLVDATATDTAANVTETVNGTSQNIPVDSVNYNDATDQTSETRTWSNAYHNLVTDNYLTGLPQGSTCSSTSTASCESVTQVLVTAVVPAPTVSISEAFTGPTLGLACGGQSVVVSGTLSSGASGSAVTVGVDESTINPGQVITTSTHTGAGGAYSDTIIAPNAADGLLKPGVNGSFGVEVSGGGATNVATLEVSPQDCTSIAYTGATSAQVGASAPVSATLTDVATGAPVASATVTFSLAGQSGTVSGVTNSSGVATASLPITDTPSATPYTLTASYAGGPTDAASSTTANFTVGLDPTTTSLTPSEPSATIGDTVTFTAHVAPTGPSLGALTGTVSFTVNGSPLGSPVPVSGGTATSAGLNTLTLGLGTYDVVGTYSGNVNYATSSGSIPAYDVHNPLTATVTNLAVSPTGSSPYGEPVSLTATVTPTVDNTDGAVTFFDGSTSLGTADLSGLTPDTANLTVSTLAVGSHSLTAEYNGDGDVQYAPSVSNPVALTVNVASTTTTVSLLTPTSAPYAFEPAVFSVTVAPPAGDTQTPSGTVQVSVNGVNLGGPLTLSAGQVTVADPAGLPAGTSTITANYAGDGNFASSSGSLSQPVAQATTTTSLVSSTGSSGSVLNQPVTFTANVTPEGTGNPTGLVTFLDCPTATPCSSQLGQSTLSPTGAAVAQATLQHSNLPEGDNYITASYGGNPNFTASSSAPPSDQVVSPPPPTAATSTTVSGATVPPSATPNLSIYGQPVTFTATVSVSGSQAAISAPTGTVQFSVDGTNLGAPVALTPGAGSPGTGWVSTATTPPVSSLVAGGHAVIATYSGLSGSGVPQAFGGSGAVVTQEVQQAATTVTGSPSANPAAFGQAETFTAVLQAVAPGAGVPGGTVQFSLDGSAFGAPAAVSGGTATSGSATGLLPGTHTVSFVTSGDPNFLGSSGSAFTFVVSAVRLQTTLVAAPNPVVFASPLTLTATVSHATGPGTPTGTVTFTDGATVLATETVSGSGSAQASFTTSSLAVGSHTITASYSGDPDFGPSSSSQVVVSVVRENTKVTASAAILTENLKNVLTSNGVLSLQPLMATLTTDKGVPIAGQTLVFTAKASPGGPLLCTGAANAQGVATCAPSAAGTLEVDPTGGFTAVFVGSPSYNGSNGSAGLHHDHPSDRHARSLPRLTRSVISGPTRRRTSCVEQLCVSGLPAGWHWRRWSPCHTAGAAITSPAANATLSSAVTVSDNGAQKLRVRGDPRVVQRPRPPTWTRPRGTAKGTVVANGTADTGTSTVFASAVASSTASTNPTSGSWITDNFGNGTYTVTSLEQAEKSSLVLFCANGTLTTARETVTVKNTGQLVYGGATTAAPGQSVTVKATLTDENNTAPANGQTVSFALSGGSTVTGTTTSGVAQATLPVTGPPRNATLTVSYAGTYFTAVSIPVAFTVTQDPTTTTLAPTSSTDYGQTATFSATVASQVAGQGTPTGFVQFTEDGVNAGPLEAVNGSGTATYSDASLGAGSHTIGAVYQGDPNFSGSSTTGTQVVAPAPTSTVITTSVQPSFFGEAITYTATVRATALLGRTPVRPVGRSRSRPPPSGGSSEPIGGAVNLTPSGANVSTASSTAISLLPAGSYTAAAAYAPCAPTPCSANFAASSSNVPQTINKAGTSVAVTSTQPSFSDFGQSVQFTATVTTAAPGQGAPTGSVDFVADASSANPIDLGTVVLNSAGADASSATSPAVSNLTPGLHTITATYTNTDGNYVSGTAGTVQQFVAPDASTTVVSTVNNANPSVFGQPVAFQATVTLAFQDAGTPTGVVLFFINGSDPPNCASPPAANFVETLVNGVATTPPDASLAVGNNTISACYASTNSDFGASGTQDPQYVQVVNPDPTTTVLTSANSPGGESGPSVWGQPVTFTASVTANAPGAGIPPGSVTFLDGSTVLGNVALSGGSITNTASLTTAALSVGNHAIEAVYDPTGVDFLTSQDAINQTVNQAQTSTALTQNGSSVQGQPVSFTATITAVAPGAGTPTGTVEFEINGADIFGGPVALTPAPGGGSEATSPSIAALTPGTYQATAIYSGDVDFLPSQQTIGQIVNAASTSTSLVASPSPAIYGTPVSLTATVTPTGQGAGLPTGSVDFYDGSTLLGAEALSTIGGNQQAVLPGHVYALGTHQFSAVYLGEYDYTGSTSPTVSDAVGLIGTTTTLASSANPSVFSTPVTFTATVTPADNSGPGPSGTVTFSDGSTVLGTAPVAVSGSTFTATLTTSTLAVGTHGITASYSGASTYSASSTASALSQVVNKDGTSLAAQNASQNTMTATLTTAQGAPLAGQSLTFTAGSTTLCSAVTTANGTASCKATGANGTTLAKAGSYTVTYAGNGSYLGSSATALSHP